MSNNFSNKRKFNGSKGREGFKSGNKGGGPTHRPRSHKPDQPSKKVADDEDAPVAVPTTLPLGSDPNEWFRRLQPKSMKARKGVGSTISLALPSSLVRYAQSRELKTYLVGQIARACSMHEVDEIIVFVDSPMELLNDPEKGPSVFICKLLQYLEAPSYLRKDMFPVNYHLKYAGLLPPLDMPHHMRKDDISLYREGVVVEGVNVGHNHSLVNVGLSTEAIVNFKLPVGTRVTVKITDLDKPSSKKTDSAEDTTNATTAAASSSSSSSARYIPGEAVSPATPRTSHGLYWGYTVRLAKSFSAIYSESPYLDEYDTNETSDEPTATTGTSSESVKATSPLDENDGLEMNFINPDKTHSGSGGKSSSSSSSQGVFKPKGYDLTIGYSEKGSLQLDEPAFELKPFKHMLIVFGGMAGIESCIDADETFGHSVHGRNAPQMFDYWLNSSPSLGSRVTRTEEAALVTLSRLRPHIEKARMVGGN